jgi:hypothetical protein
MTVFDPPSAQGGFCVSFGIRISTRLNVYGEPPEQSVKVHSPGVIEKCIESRLRLKFSENLASQFP